MSVSHSTDKLLEEDTECCPKTVVPKSMLQLSVIDARISWSVPQKIVAMPVKKYHACLLIEKVLKYKSILNITEAKEIGTG